MLAKFREFFLSFCREHVDLVGFLDYEIWKASHMLAQGVPLQKQIEGGNPGGIRTTWYNPSDWK